MVERKLNVSGYVVVIDIRENINPKDIGEYIQASKEFANTNYVVILAEGSAKKGVREQGNIVLLVDKAKLIKELRIPDDPGYTVNAVVNILGINGGNLLYLPYGSGPHIKEIKEEYSLDEIEKAREYAAESRKLPKWFIGVKFYCSKRGRDEKTMEELVNLPGNRGSLTGTLTQGRPIPTIVEIIQLKGTGSYVQLLPGGQTATRYVSFPVKCRERGGKEKPTKEPSESAREMYRAIQTIYNSTFNDMKKSPEFYLGAFRVIKNLYPNDLEIQDYLEFLDGLNSLRGGKPRSYVIQEINNGSRNFPGSFRKLMLL